MCACAHTHTTHTPYKPLMKQFHLDQIYRDLYKYLCSSFNYYVVSYGLGKNIHQWENIYSVKSEHHGAQYSVQEPRLEGSLEAQDYMLMEC